MLDCAIELDVLHPGDFRCVQFRRDDGAVLCVQLGVNFDDSDLDIEFDDDALYRGVFHVQEGLEPDPNFQHVARPAGQILYLENHSVRVYCLSVNESRGQPIKQDPVFLVQISDEGVGEHYFPWIKEDEGENT